VSAELSRAALLVAALAGLSVVLLGFGIWRAQRRRETARRIATLLALDEAHPGQATSAPIVAPVPRWRLELVQALAALQARDSLLRAPAVALACVAALIGLATISSGWILVAAAAGLAGYWLGGHARRRERIEAQALYAMQLLSGGLRAGYSVPQAITLVARHSPEPTASEFRLAAQEISVGVQLEDAMARLATRTANADYALVSIIIGVQHEVGGNLAQILDSVSNTLRERFELRRQVNALTAQQRLSSMVLTILPFALLAFLSFVDRSFVEPLFTQTIGRFLLVLSGMLVVIGWSVMRRIGRVEV
jgi:tight adherence protein B